VDGTIFSRFFSSVMCGAKNRQSTRLRYEISTLTVTFVCRRGKSTQYTAETTLKENLKNKNCRGFPCGFCVIKEVC